MMFQHRESCIEQRKPTSFDGLAISEKAGIDILVVWSCRMA